MSSDAKWSICGVIVGLLLTIFINIVAESFREGSIESRLESLENEVSKRSVSVETGIQTELRVGHLETQFQNISIDIQQIGMRITVLERDGARIGQALINVADTNRLITDALNGNTKALINLGKTVAVLDNRVANLEDKLIK